MKKSFRRQLTIIFTAVMAGTLVLMFFCGAVFLESYYIADKKEQVMDAYIKFNTAAGEGTIDSEVFQVRFKSFSLTSDITGGVVGT